MTSMNHPGLLFWSAAYIPLKDFPKSFVLNPLYLDNIEASQGCTKKCFQLLKFIRSPQESYSLQYTETGTFSVVFITVVKISKSLME